MPDMGTACSLSRSAYCRGGWLCLAWLAALCAAPCPQRADAADRVKLNRETIVSPEDFSYRLLAKLAADGRVPGAPALWFTGEFRWTRLEMARFVASALECRNSGFGIRNSGGGERSQEPTSPSPLSKLGEVSSQPGWEGGEPAAGASPPEWADRALAALAEEYRNELEYLGVRAANPVGQQQADSQVPNSEFRIPNSERLYDRSGLGIAQLSVRIDTAGSAEIEGSLGLLQQLGNPQRFAWLDLRPRATLGQVGTLPTSGSGLPTRLLLHEAQLSLYRPDFRLRVGQDHVRWGPGYRGTFPLSDFPDPFPMVEYRGRLHSLITNGEPWRPFFSSLDWVIGSYPDQGVQTYLFARRAEFDLGGDLDFGLYETAKLDRPPPWYYFLPIPILITESVAARYDPNYPGIPFNNRLIGLDATFRAGPSLKLYGELSIDELNAYGIAQQLGLLEFLQDLFGGLGLGLFQGGESPNEVGAQIGAYLPRVFSDRTKLRLEYALTTARYSIHPRNPAIDLVRDGQPLGHRMGPDAASLFIRLERLASEKHSVAAEYETTVSGRSTPAPSASSSLRLLYYYSPKPADAYSVGLELGSGGPSYWVGAAMVF